MKKKCSIENCEREVFKETGKCVLHCEKNNSSFLKGDNSEYFCDILAQYIASFFFINEGVEKDFGVKREDFEKYLLFNSYGSNKKSILHFLNVIQPESKFDSIYFPNYGGQCFNDYHTILQRIKYAHFYNCKFIEPKIEIPEVKVFFENCEFHQPWTITPSTLFKNNNTLYKNCTFKEEVCLGFKELKSNPPDDSPDVFLFDSCSLEKGISLQGNKNKSSSVSNASFKINELQIKGCIVQGKVDLNNIETDKLVIKDTIFKGKFELAHGIIHDIELNNTNFEKIFHSHSTEYGKFLCHKSIFKDFAGFEDGTFGVIQDDNKLNGIAKFEYVTFESFTNFRSTKFNLGLDLERTNFKEYPNFLDITIESDNTNRETFRILKYSFDKIGNHIEANKFFAREMAKYKQELSGKSLTQERFVFWFNEKASKFGQSYVRPIVGIVGFAIVYYLLTLGHKNNLLYSFFSYSINKKITWLSCHLNGIAKSILPFRIVTIDGMEFVSILFDIIFATLIWLTIVAVKRHTRR